MVHRRMDVHDRQASVAQIKYVCRADNLTTLYADCLEKWETQPPGILRASPGL